MQTGDVEAESDSEAPTDLIQLEKILVQSDRAYSTASSKSIRQFDLHVRPMQTAQDMLQLAPGLVITQHAGGGKAETDLSTWLRCRSRHGCCHFN